MYNHYNVYDINDAARKRYYKRILWKWLKILFVVIIIISSLVCIILFIIIPIIFMYSIELQRLVMFTNINLPADKEYYRSFEAHGLHNFYINVENQKERRVLSLGAWHLLPERLLNTSSVRKDFNYVDSLKDTNYSVILYFHGSGETRADLLKKCYRLRLLFHVIIFDYRDYADSTPAILSESAIVEDSIYLYNWLRSITNTSIYVWGHSLGTPLSSNMIAHLKSEGVVPFGLVLESPLTSMREEIPNHPYGKLFSWLPWFEPTILDPLEKNGFHFDTIKYILNVECPIMILHAEDDSIIPYTLGEKLYYYAVTRRNASYGSAFLHLFNARCEHDHFFIYEDEKFIFYISEFMQYCDNYAKKKGII